MGEQHIPQPMNPEQVKNLLKFIETTQSEHTKNEIFSRLGYECFHSGRHEAWVEKCKGDVPAFLDRINNQHTSKYWESLLYNEDKSELILTGQPVQGCACAFADCSQPPHSLCQTCCKSFQEAYFGALFERKVEVEITETFLFGSERCCSIIRFLPE